MQGCGLSFRLLKNAGNQLIFARNLTVSHNLVFDKKISATNHQQHRFLSQSTYANYFSIDVFPIKCAYTVLDTIHSTTGLPWWATILTTTFALRTVITLPIFVLVAKNSMKLEILRPQIMKMSEDLKQEISRAQKELKWTKEVAYGQYKLNMSRLVREAYIQHNCHPGKNLLLPWLQIPIWVSMSMALRNMSGSFGNEMPALCPELAVEGTLWFQNLLIPDVPLSITFFLINFIIIELHNRRMPKKTKITKTITNFSRVFNFIMLPIAMAMPCSLSFYWTCSSFYGLVQNLVVTSPTFKKALLSKNISSIKLDRIYKKSNNK